jgi:hypothetical protein
LRAEATVVFLPHASLNKSKIRFKNQLVDDLT